MSIATWGAPKSFADLVNLLADSGDTKVRVAGIDVDGVIRGKFMSKDKFLKAASDGFGFCSVIFGWDIQDMIYSKELSIANQANGFRDVFASIDLSTYRRIPWEGNVPFFLVSFFDPTTKQPLSVDPRGILKTTTERAARIDRECIAGVEYEYFNFKETPETLAKKNFKDLQPLTPGMHGYSVLRPQLNSDYFRDLFDESVKFGIDIEGHHTETGPGVFETALAYTTALRVADNAILFKYLAKSIGIKYGVVPSFMAKPWGGNLPGCGGHVHVSLRNSAGENSFAVSDSEMETGRNGAAYEDTKFISEEGEWFLAGILEGLPDVMPMLVPTVNGYKRLVSGEAFWAPNAISYGYDSRGASIRIISPPSVKPAATRLEVRVPGADLNPYYALSAIFSLGLRGIQKKSKLLCPPISQCLEKKRNGTLELLPTTLESATERMMRPGSIAREPEVFGNSFVDHFGATREHEVKLWNTAVTDWEIERYLELA